MKLYILVEDTKKGGKLEAEHGLSMYFEKDAKHFLFDTGQSDAFLRNARTLGIDLSEVEYLALSHGHYDHTGGLTHLKLGDKTNIIAHPYCIYPKYDGDRYIGFPQYKDDWILLLEDKPRELTPNVHFLGQIPGKRGSSLGHYLKDGVKHTDFLLDDTAIVVNEGTRSIVLSGCAHSGIKNIAKYAKKLFKPEKMVIVGGFHMLNYSEEEVDDTIAKLQELNVVQVYPGHCTGEKAIDRLLESFDGERLYSGKVIEV